jgi:hypothetical protein
MRGDLLWLKIGKLSSAMESQKSLIASREGNKMSSLEVPPLE